MPRTKTNKSNSRTATKTFLITAITTAGIDSRADMVAFMVETERVLKALRHSVVGTVAAWEECETHYEGTWDGEMQPDRVKHCHCYVMTKKKMRISALKNLLGRLIEDEQCVMVTKGHFDIRTKTSGERKTPDHRGGVGYVLKDKDSLLSWWASGLGHSWIQQLTDDSSYMPPKPGGSAKYEWQEVVHAVATTTDSDGRKVTVIVDKAGNMGKTTLLKYLAIYEGACVVGGKSGDMMNLLCKFIEEHGAPTIVCVNVTRKIEQYVSWTGIEQCADGMCVNTKYEGGVHCFKPPHVFVFTNSFPSTEDMSEDRWNILEIGLDGPGLYRQLSIERDFAYTAPRARPCFERMAKNDDEEKKGDDSDVDMDSDLEREILELAADEVEDAGHVAMERVMAGGTRDEFSEGELADTGDGSDHCNHEWVEWEDEGGAAPDVRMGECQQCGGTVHMLRGSRVCTLVK